MFNFIKEKLQKISQQLQQLWAVQTGMVVIHQKEKISEEEKRANVIVPEDQLSIAIGKGGQNVRLASKLTGYEIDIVSNGTPNEVKTEEPAEVKVEAKPAGKLKRKSELENSLLDAIEEHGE